MADDVHDAALASGRLRYCPVCDGFEVTDQIVGVIGEGAHGAREAIFLRSHSSKVTPLTPTEDDRLDKADRNRLRAAGVQVAKGPLASFGLTAAGLCVHAPDGPLVFDAVYPALGSDVHSALAERLGANVADEGCIKVDSHQRTSIPGVYAAGDIVIGLDQISHAMGQAGVAATAIRNDLAEIMPLRRRA